jgi:dTDP-4-amino-4,6-dideoxygalactose transaminase
MKSTLKPLTIPFAKVPVGSKELMYIREVLDSGWLTTAGKAMAFEQQFAKMTGAKYACAVNSCTAALHLAIEAAGVKQDDKVFVPSMTFTASAEVIRYMGAHPVFLDTEYGTNLVTGEILKAAIRRHPDVKCLVIVHFGGQAAQMTGMNGNSILNICRSHGIKIIEDAAHAFPSRLNGKMVGSIGDITCFSFYANKTITTGEGGMLVTNDENIYKRTKVMRLHGINRDIWDRYTAKKATWMYDVIDAGYKYNMSDLNAAVGLAQLENAYLYRRERQRVAEFYYRELGDLSMIDLPVCRVPFEDHAWHLFPIVLNDSSSISRNEFIDRMTEAGISTSVHYRPLHTMTFYKEKYKLNPLDYPNTEKTWKGNVSLPIYPFMSNDQLYYIIEIIRSILV